MRFIYLILCFGLFGLSACATVDNPIDKNLLNDLNLSKVSVDFEPAVNVPEQYDKAVQDVLNTKGHLGSVIRFQNYLQQSSVNNTKDFLAENYIAFRLEEEIVNRIDIAMNGQRDVNINIMVKEAYTPGSVAKVLANVNDRIQYDMDLVDAQTGAVIVDFDQPINISSRRYIGNNYRYTRGTSAALIGYLVGSAVTEAIETDFSFLEKMTNAIANETRQILLDGKVKRSTSRRLRENGKIIKNP